MCGQCETRDKMRSWKSTSLCSRFFCSFHLTLVIRVREQQTPYRYLGERRACGGDFASRAHCVPGLERVDRLHPRSLDCGFTVGAGLPAHGGDVHKPGRRPLNCVPGAARPLADPLWAVSGKGIEQPRQRAPCPLWVKSRYVQRKQACPLYPRKRTRQSLS